MDISAPAAALASTHTVLLVDDHVLFRDGVELLVAARLPGVRLYVAGHVAAALDALRAHPECSLVLLDLALPDSAGLAGLARLRDAAPELPVVVISADERPRTILDAIDRGASGFIPKTADADAFAAALRRVLDGGVYLPPQVVAPSGAGAFDIDDGGTAGDGDALGLSPRQMDVLRLLIEGRSNKLIMRELELSESTVKTHLQAIFRRLGVGSRTQAVVAAARLGLRLHG